MLRLLKNKICTVSFPLQVTQKLRSAIRAGETESLKDKYSLGYSETEDINLFMGLQSKKDTHFPNLLCCVILYYTVYYTEVTADGERLPLP